MFATNIVLPSISNTCTDLPKVLCTIIFPSLAHTIYDSLIFYAIAVDSILAILLFLVLDIAMVVLCFITVSKTSKIQQNLNTNVSNGVVSLNQDGILTYQKKKEIIDGD